MKTYCIHRAIPSAGFWPNFNRVPSDTLGSIRPESSAHHPRTTFRALHDGEFIYVHFDVKDRYVRSVSTEPQASVCGDSCVEFYVKPFSDRGYFNFEMNAGGNLLLYFVENPIRTPDGFKKFTRVAPGWCSQVVIETSLPRIVDPEITRPLSWHLSCRLPFALLSAYCGKDASKVKACRGNFCTCADNTSHPYWVTWAPVPKLNYHDPEHFGKLTLE